jgi:hypothetical protein
MPGGETPAKRVRSARLRVGNGTALGRRGSETMAGSWRLLPVGRATAAWWAWKNRRELGRWLGFAWRAVPPSAADRADLLAEARLRAALAKDPRTRGIPSLSVRVLARTAFLEGSLAPHLHDLVASIARGTKGVLRVECGIQDRGHRRIPVSHAHALTVNALPPPPERHRSARSSS